MFPHPRGLMDAGETAKIQKALEEYGLVEKYSYGVRLATCKMQCRYIIMTTRVIHKVSGLCSNFSKYISYI